MNIRLGIIFILLVLTVGCQKAPEVVSLSGKTMGTTFLIRYVETDQVPPKEKLFQEVKRKLAVIDNTMSTFNKNSELSKFNRNRSTKWIRVTTALFDILMEANFVSKMSDGAFDVTSGPVVNLWGFGPDGEKKVPTDQQIKAVKAISGYQKLKIDLGSLSIRKTNPDLYLDLSAIAKGYGVDLTALLLKMKNVSNYMIEIGGEVRTSGTKNGKPWRIAIASPHPTEKNYNRILEFIEQGAIATSGDYRNFFEKNGKRYSHIINVKTGKPVKNDLASVTVISRECLRADAYATMFMALGLKKGIKLANKNDISAYFIYRKDDQFEEVYSNKFKEFLVEKKENKK